MKTQLSSDLLSHETNAHFWDQFLNTFPIFLPSLNLNINLSYYLFLIFSLLKILFCGFVSGVVGQPRGMTTEDKINTLHSPESDCNSNNLDSTGSYLSNTSSQDVDFIQDNSDYQWFLDYG